MDMYTKSSCSAVYTQFYLKINEKNSENMSPMNVRDRLH